MPDKKEEKSSPKKPSKKAYKGSSARLLNVGYAVVGLLVLLSMATSLVVVGTENKTPKTPTPVPPTPVALADLQLDGSPTKGSADAPIKIVVYGDFQSTGDK